MSQIFLEIFGTFFLPPIISEPLQISGHPSPNTSHCDKGDMDERAMIQGLAQRPRITLVFYEVTPGIKVSEET